MMNLNHKEQIEFLKENCPAFQKYREDVIQAVVDNLTAVNLIAESEKKMLKGIEETLGERLGNLSAYITVSGTQTVLRIQEINKNLMTKIREM